MPEKITILKESGESVVSNIMSIFVVPESNKQYIITTENAVDPHGLTVLHVSEIRGDKIVKIQTDDEWATIKTIMRSIISGSVSSFKYIPIINNVNAADTYSRDISVSAGAAKTLLESYTNGKKEVAVADDTTPIVDPNAISSDSIFPTAPVDTDKDAEIVPGISEVDNPLNIEPSIVQPDVGVASTPDSGTTENSDTPPDDGAGAPVIPIVNNMVEVPEDNNENNDEDPNAGGRVLTDNSGIVSGEPIPEEQPTIEENNNIAVPLAEPVLENTTPEIVPNVEEISNQDITESVPETNDIVTPEIPEIPITPEVPEIPVTPDVPEISIENTNPVSENVTIPEDVEPDEVTEEQNNNIDLAPTEEAVDNSETEVTNTDSETSVPIENTEIKTEAEEPISIDFNNPENSNIPVTDSQVSIEENQEGEQPVIEEPQITEPTETNEVKTEQNVNVVNTTVDAETVKEALSDVVDSSLSTVITNKADELIPSTIENSVTKAVDGAITNIQAPLEQKIEESIIKVVEDKIQTTLKKAVEDTVSDTIEKQSKALNSLGIKLDFGVKSSFGKNASLDEIVAGAQELFVEGVKNLIMVMTERVYKELRLKEEELKKREVIVSQREQAVNDKTMAMMNGTYTPESYTQTSIVPPSVAVPPATPTAPAIPSVPAAPEVPATPVVPETPATPVVPAVEQPVQPEIPPAETTTEQVNTQTEPVVAEASPTTEPVPTETSQTVEPVPTETTPSIEVQQEAPAVDNTPVIEIPDATGNTSSLAVAEAVPVTETEPTTEAPASDTNPQT